MPHFIIIRVSWVRVPPISFNNLGWIECGNDDRWTVIAFDLGKTAMRCRPLPKLAATFGAMRHHSPAIEMLSKDGFVGMAAWQGTSVIMELII